MKYTKQIIVYLTFLPYKVDTFHHKHNTPYLRKGGGYHPLTICRRLHQNATHSDPGHLSNLFYILCGHFDEKKIQGYP